MKKKLEESKTQREEIKNLKKEKRELTKKKNWGTVRGRQQIWRGCYK